MLYLGMTTFALKDMTSTRAILEESNAIAEANMDRWAHAFGLNLLGLVSLAQGQNEEALEYFRHSIAFSKEIGDQLSAAQFTVHLGQAYAALRSNAEAKRLFLEAYADARQAKWTPITLYALISFAEMQNGLPAATKLAVALSVLSHPALTPNMRVRCERLRDETTASLSAAEIEAAENLAREKNSEELAQEILRLV
jgi:tetratricopeptide (TPR) repeat protein